MRRGRDFRVFDGSGAAQYRLALMNLSLSRRAAWRLGCRLILPGALLAASGCASPLKRPSDQELRESILDSARREMREASRSPQPITLTRQERVSSLELKPHVMAELEGMAGPSAQRGVSPPLGPSLLGLEGGGGAGGAPAATEPRVVSLTLERAVRTGVNNNLNVQFARLAPSINEAQVVAAQAAFDWVFFSNFNWNDTDEPRTSPSIGGSTVGVTTDQRQVVELQTGIRRRLVTGGQFTVQHDFKYTDVNTRNLFNRPDPARETNIVVQLDQPLLRNFGSDVAQAQIRLNKNMERDEIQALKAALLQNVTDVETAYWGLVGAYNELKILQRLLDRGEAVRIVIKNRLPVDAKQWQYSDAAARVESRRSDVVRAQEALSTASDRLKQLMNDPELTIGSDILILPADEAVDAPIRFSLLDSQATAFTKRPEVQRALISIDNTAIRRIVADNGLLPKFDLRLQTQITGLGSSTHGAYHELTAGDFIDYAASLQFEQPIGNREAQANSRVRRLEQLQAVIAYRNTVQGIAGEVNTALRSVVSGYVLIEQTRAARIAATENLRALLVEKQLIQGLTAEFLNLEFNRQELLAQTERQEVAALTNYNVSIAKLHQAMGTALERNQIDFQVPDVEPVTPQWPLFPRWDFQTDEDRRLRALAAPPPPAPRPAPPAGDGAPK